MANKHQYLEAIEPKKTIPKTPKLALINNQKLSRIISPSLAKIILSLILIYPFAQAGYNKFNKNWEFIYYRYIQKMDTWDDREALIAKYLRERIKSTDYIYVVNYEPIIYYLVPTKIPTKYPTPPYPFFPPTSYPTVQPTISPSTAKPTNLPTPAPSYGPTGNCNIYNVPQIKPL